MSVCLKKATFRGVSQKRTGKAQCEAKNAGQALSPRGFQRHKFTMAQTESNIEANALFWDTADL